MKHVAVIRTFNRNAAGDSIVPARALICLMPWPVLHADESGLRGGPIGHDRLFGLKDEALPGTTAAPRPEYRRVVKNGRAWFPIR
ncbi:MAG TPA: hypothetical protein VGG01_22265 [Xanthobacteraceae bacterium]|jgi:hypothetical protein